MRITNRLDASLWIVDWPYAEYKDSLRGTQIPHFKKKCCLLTTPICCFFPAKPTTTTFPMVVDEFLDLSFKLSFWVYAPVEFNSISVWKRSWYDLVRFGPFGSFLVLFGSVWFLLVPFGSFWFLLVLFGSFWFFLIFFWFLLVPIGSFWFPF